MNKYLILSVVILLAIIGGLYRQIKEVNKKWETAEGNVKAYANIVSNAKGEALALQLTVS